MGRLERGRVYKQALRDPIAKASVAANPPRTYITATGRDGFLWYLPSGANTDSLDADWLQFVPQGKQPVLPAIVAD